MIILLLGKNFGICQGKKDQTIDQYIMHYETYKIRMKRYKIDQREKIHCLNLLCGAVCQMMNCVLLCVKLMGDTPDTMYDQAKKSLKKYFDCSGMANSAVAPTPVFQLITPKKRTKVPRDNRQNSFSSSRRKFTDQQNKRNQILVNYLEKIFLEAVVKLLNPRLLSNCSFRT